MRIHKYENRMWIHFGKNGESHVCFELGRIIPLDFGFHIGVDTEDVTLGVYLLLFDFYISIASKHISKFLNKHPNYHFKKTWEGGEDGAYWEERNIGIRLDLREHAFSGEFWDNMNRNIKGRSFYYFLDDVFLGRAKYSEKITQEGEIKINMPEGIYDATYKLFTSYWRRPRWPFIKKIDRVSIDIPVGIPHEGKGENSWDCGMDATFGTTMPREKRESIYDIAERFAMRCLETRQKYGRLNSPDYLKWKKDGEKRLKTKIKTIQGTIK